MVFCVLFYTHTRWSKQTPPSIQLRAYYHCTYILATCATKAIQQPTCKQLAYECRNSSVHPIQTLQLRHALTDASGSLHRKCYIAMLQNAQYLLYKQQKYSHRHDWCILCRQHLQVLVGHQFALAEQWSAMRGNIGVASLGSTKHLLQDPTGMQNNIRYMHTIHQLLAIVSVA